MPPTHAPLLSAGPRCVIGKMPCREGSNFTGALSPAIALHRRIAGVRNRGQRPNILSVGRGHSTTAENSSATPTPVQGRATCVCVCYATQLRAGALSFRPRKRDQRTVLKRLKKNTSFGALRRRPQLTASREGKKCECALGALSLSAACCVVKDDARFF